MLKKSLANVVFLMGLCPPAFGDGYGFQSGPSWGASVEGSLSGRTSAHSWSAVLGVGTPHFQGVLGLRREDITWDPFLEKLPKPYNMPLVGFRALYAITPPVQILTQLHFLIKTPVKAFAQELQFGFRFKGSSGFFSDYKVGFESGLYTENHMYFYPSAAISLGWSMI